MHGVKEAGSTMPVSGDEVTGGEGVPLYDSSSGVPAWIREIGELIRFRDLLGVLIVNLTKTRYKRSALGAIWTLLNPLLHMVVLTVAFSHLFRFEIENYPVYVLSGLICWNFFSQTTTFAMNNLIWGGNLLKRVYLPRTVFSVASVGNGVVNLALSILALIVIMMVSGYPFHGTWWFLPLSVAMLVAFSLGCALLVSAAAVYFSDVAEMYGVALQALFFLTPVIYPKSIVPQEFLGWFALSPLWMIVEVFRGPIYGGMVPETTVVLSALAWSLGMLIVGWMVFCSRCDRIAFRI